MKKSTATLTSALGLALGALNAQTVPPFINYQGKVTDSSGVGLGTGTPVNRKVIFRVFDTPSGDNRLWSEQHTVTISNGEFSVLLGNGIDAVYNAVTETPTKTNTPLERVFTSPGTSRYVEIVVDNGDGTLNTSDAAISPRQQITSTAYSFRARAADTITSGTDLQLNDSANYGLGYYGSTRLFNGTAVDGPVLFGQAGGALGSMSGASKNIALRWNATGAVGIGSADLAGAAPTTKLVLQGDDPNTIPLQLNIRGNSDTNKRLLLGYNTNSNYGSLQSYNGASSAGTLALNASGGNVGIGTTAPANALAIQRTIGSSNFVVNQHILQLEIRNGIGEKSMGIGIMDDGKGVVQVKEKNNGAGYGNLLLNPISGNVGIGTDSAPNKLQVAGPIASSWSGAVNIGVGQVALAASPASPWSGKTIFGGDGTSWRYSIASKNGTAAEVDHLVVTDQGRVGVGVTAPSVALDVAGDIKASAISASAISVGGRITSPQFKVTDVMPYRFGNIPGGERFIWSANGGRTATYAASGGTWLVTVNCSGFANGWMGFVFSYKKSGETAWIQKYYDAYGNNDVHRHMGCQIILTGLQAGTYDTRLSSMGGNVDQNDYSQVTIMEMPY